MLNDELIGAYLDGELDAEKRALVEHWLASDKGAAARLDRIRAADALMREAIPRVAAPEDDPIAALIRGQAERRPPRLTRQSAVRAAALAAACVLGVLAGRAMSPSLISINPSADARMRVGAEVAQALDSTPSGETVPVLGGEVRVAMSFQTEAGKVCRQYRTTSGHDAADAVACRDEDGWRMIVQASATDVDGDAFVPAGSNSPLDAAISALGPAVALDSREERALMGVNWRIGGRQ